MKKLSIFAAAALMLAAVSCNKEAAPIAEPEQGTPAVQKITFTAYADNGADTRTILNGNDIKWAVGETIYVFDGTAPRAFTSTNTEEAAIVTFEGEAAEAETYTAVFPAATMTGSTINATIPVYQTATAGSFDPKSNVAVAVSGTDPNDPTLLQFKNAGAVVTFKLTDADVTKVRLDAIGGEKLAGKASITLNGDVPAVAMASDAESCVILKPVEGNFAANTTYAIAIAPGTYAQGFKLTLFKENGQYKSFSNKNTQTLGRNNMMDFGTIPAVQNWKGTLVESTDVITYSLIGVTGTAYTEWDNLTCSSSAVYAGMTSGGNTSIQMRSSTSDAKYTGIVSTSTGGRLKSVTVDWNSNSASGRTLDIYGSNTAYESAADLYDNNTRGTKLGSIVNGQSTSLTISGDYAYVGIRSSNNSLNLNKITFVWEKWEGHDAPADPDELVSVFEITNQTPSDGSIAAAGETASFVIHSSLPWTLDAVNEANIPYSLSSNGDNTTVTATFGSISEGSRSLLFTVTSSEGSVKTVSFVQKVASVVPIPESKITPSTSNCYKGTNNGELAYRLGTGSNTGSLTFAAGYKEIYFYLEGWTDGANFNITNGKVGSSSSISTTGSASGSINSGFTTSYSGTQYTITVTDPTKTVKISGKRGVFWGFQGLE